MKIEIHSLGKKLMFRCWDSFHSKEDEGWTYSDRDFKSVSAFWSWNQKLGGHSNEDFSYWRSSTCKA